MLQIRNRAVQVIPALIGVALLVSSCAVAAPVPITPPPPPPPPLPENHKPVINYMTSQQQVLPSSTSRITCVATDADDDTLTYAWSSDSGGTITGTGDTVTWNAPEVPGSYVINVSVTDGKGGEAKDLVTVAVATKPNRTPTATLIVGEKGAPEVTVTPTTGKITVKRWSTTEIECKAEDPDGDPLTYKWNASEGKVDGEGPKVQFIASHTGDIAITATVADTRGAQAKVSVYFHVPCCGAG